MQPFVDPFTDEEGNSIRYLVHTDCVICGLELIAIQDGWTDRPIADCPNGHSKAMQSLMEFEFDGRTKCHYCQFVEIENGDDSVGLQSGMWCEFGDDDEQSSPLMTKAFPFMRGCNHFKREVPNYVIHRKDETSEQYAKRLDDHRTMFKSCYKKFMVALEQWDLWERARDMEKWIREQEREQLKVRGIEIWRMW